MSKWRQDMMQTIRANYNAVMIRATSLSSLSPSKGDINRLLRRSSMPTLLSIISTLEASSSILEYEILCVLGSGTFGVVKLARHRSTNHPVAIKILSKDQVVDMRQETNLLREQRIHLGLSHHCIARMYTTFQDHEAVYFVLEYVPGGELYRLIYTDERPVVSDLEEEPQNDDVSDVINQEKIERRSSFLNDQATRSLRLGWMYGGLHESHVAFYLACLADAMEYLHTQYIVYRDLKLENIVLDSMGYPKLIDFGLSKLLQTNSESCTTVCGSMEYMAPEIFRRQGYDSRAELWSFGVVMYELLFGTTPFFHGNPQEQTRRIMEEDVVFPCGFENEYPHASHLLRVLLAKDPNDRPDSIRTVRNHPFFQQYFPSTKAWKQLETRKIQAPFVPTIENEFDTSLFPTAYKVEDEEDENN